MSKILVVEDENLLMKAVETKLVKRGYEVISAGTGEEALEKLSEKPDLVWLDLLLPKMQGLDFLSKLRREKKYSEFKDLPVIIVSNSGSGDKMKHAFELNVVDYLVKAKYSMGDIIDKIDKTLQNN